MKKQYAILLIAAYARVCWANGLESLENFIKNTHSGKAEFTQTVTTPAKTNGDQGSAPRVKNSSGSFEFARPAKFKFHYKKPFEQIIVADGQTLWLYDIDLNQVTQRKQSAVLSNTPAALIASAPDLATLKASFTLENAPDKDGLTWVQATPKASDGQVQAVLVGFKGNDLSALEIRDALGQKSVLKFNSLQTNPALASDAFVFKPPEKADVLRQ
jgi:outer membrane lipoprotein carrier protein